MSPEQKRLLSLFKEINDICNRHNIVYYMAGGTLIGAIRHKGFIPWDDDMDILMTRDNWEKFIEVTRTDIPENRVLECQELDRNYPNMFGRYTDVTSTAIHNNQVLGDGICGYVVDILVLDPIPDKEHHEKYTADLMLYSDLVNPSLNYSYRFDVNQRFMRRMQKEGKDKVLTELEDKMFRYNEEDCQYYVMRWGGAPFLFDKDMYGSSRWGVFEGVKCRIPDRTADYLTWHYGDDWMYIPPHGEHESHDAIFSFTTQYKTIQNDYMRYIDVHKVRKSLIKRKMFFFKHMDSRLRMKDMEVTAIGVSVKMDTLKAVENCGFDIYEALDNCEYEKISELFSDYYSKQLSRKVIGREDYTGINRFRKPGYCDIGDELLYPAVMVLIHTGRIAKAARLLDVREINKGPLDDKLASARQLIMDFRKAVSDDDLGHKDESFEQMKSLYEKYSHNDNINMFYIEQLLERNDVILAEKLSKRALDLFPNNGVYMKYLGDCIYGQDEMKALNIYADAVSNTTNGVVLLQISERVESRKTELMSKAAADLDLELAKLLTLLSPDDVDLVKLKYDIMTETTSDGSELATIITELKDELIKFDMASPIRSALSNAYIKRGESEATASLRVSLVMASTIDEYHEIKDKAIEICQQQPDSHAYRLLSDVYNTLGMTTDADASMSEADRMEN